MRLSVSLSFELMSPFSELRIWNFLYNAISLSSSLASSGIVRNSLAKRILSDRVALQTYKFKFSFALLLSQTQNISLLVFFLFRLLVSGFDNWFLSCHVKHKLEPGRTQPTFIIISACLVTTLIKGTKSRRQIMSLKSDLRVILFKMYK